MRQTEQRLRDVSTCAKITVCLIALMDLSDYLALERELRGHTDYEELARYIGIDYDIYYESMIGVNEDVPDYELSPVQEHLPD